MLGVEDVPLEAMLSALSKNGMGAEVVARTLDADLAARNHVRSDLGHELWWRSRLDRHVA